MTISPQAFDEIYDLLEPRLNEVGPIRATEAWALCKGKTKLSYGTINNVFRYCMDIMVKQRKAEKLRTGVWEILKPNDPLAWIDKIEIKNLIQ